MLQYRQGGADCVPRTFIWPNETKLSSGLPLLRCFYSVLTMLVLSEKSRMGQGGVRRDTAACPTCVFLKEQGKHGQRAGLGWRGEARSVALGDALYCPLPSFFCQSLLCS